MAALYGRLQGSRGQATRCGTKDSGIRSQLETWEGRILTCLNADGTFQVSISDKHGNRGRILVEGNVNDDVARYLLPTD